MNILVLNASPKGASSVTLQTALYLQALNPAHTFTVAHVGQRIRAYEQDFSPLRGLLQKADLLLFCYPVYTFIAPYSLHRLMELIKADKINLSGKFATQITTSKHFFDVTAHAWLEANCLDLGMRVIRGHAADMDDLLTEKGQREARQFFEQVLFACVHGPFVPAPPTPPAQAREIYRPVLAETPKKGGDVVVITNADRQDAGLLAMIADFRAALPYKSRVVNLRDFRFGGGCLGCLSCAVTGKCVYRDGFEDFLRGQIQTADAMVYAFTIENHYTHSSFKCFDDRQFCNGHRTVTRGTPVGYLISGHYRYEPNLQTLIQARAEVGGNYLCGVATDEDDPAGQIRSLAENMAFALENALSRPANFYGVGGTKIFRDLIYTMQGMMKADHRFYKANGMYDFPQKQRALIWKMKLVGALLAIPSVKKKMGGRMSGYILAPYRKVVDAAKAQDKA